MRLRSSLLLASFATLFAAGCSRDSEPTGPAPISTESRVFIDNFIAVDFQAFSGSTVTAVQLDNVVKYRGTSSLRITVPGPGSYAGGAFVATEFRNLSGYNAITFYARSSVAASLNVAGLGNDNTGNSLYTAERSAIALTPAWTKYTIAIPLASRLTLEKGLFYFAEGAEGAAGYDFWIDDLRFENLPGITNIRPALAPATVAAEIGGTHQIGGLTVTAAVDGVDHTVTAFPSYFSFTSSTPATGTVSAGGLVSMLAAGTTNITASLGGVAATGVVAMTAIAPPAVAAPTPTRLAADVISLFSNAYTNVTVDNWSADWDVATVSDISIAGNAVKRYSGLSYAGVLFESAPINATTMTHFHIDAYVNNATNFKIKLVNFGANGTFGGGDDSEHEVTYTPTSTPPMVTGAWVSLDIPLSAFTGLTGRTSLAQMVISGSSPTTYIDNVYFYKVPGPPPPTEPTVAAPAPTELAANVISLFSNAYTNVNVSAWGTDWDVADVADVSIAGDAVKKITNFTFVGIEFLTPTIDATAMTHFNFDYWTPDATDGGADLKVKLVDAGANGVIGTGGDDTEFELTFTAATTPGIATGEWKHFSIPLSSFTGLAAKAQLGQLIMVSGPNTVFLDNIYFSGAAAPPPPPPTVPVTAAPTPTYLAADVISLFSNAYTNGTVDRWSTDWDVTDVADVQIAGNDTKQYTNLTFAGIEFLGANAVDATTMTHFRLDIWTPDASAVPAAFKVKLVDAGANGVIGTGGDDKEHELSFEATTTPALATGAWTTLEIPLAQFAGLTTRASLQQLILVGLDPINTVFVDNVLFYKDAAPPAPTVPVTAAPTPTYAAGDVISLFSNAYTNITVDRWSTDWDVTDVADVDIAGNATKRYTNLTFAGIEFLGANAVNATTMTHFRLDIWTPDASAVPAAFKVKLVDAGANGVIGTGGDDKEHELSFEATTTPALVSGAWLTLDIPLANFTGLTTRASLQQLILVGLDPINTVFVDNVLFYRSAAPPTVPVTAAPTPTYAAGDVISLFSNAYTNITVDRWSTDWDVTDVADVDIAGNATKRYTNLTFAGIEFLLANAVNATTMTHFRLDIWTPDASAVPAAFKVKLVDAGANGVIGTGGDDKEHELSFEATTTPALTTGAWITLDIPLAQFTGLTTRASLQQLILVGLDPINTVFVDNVLFHK